MTPWSYARLLEEAKISLAMLNESAFDQFEATFILRKDHPLQEYDISFQLPNSTAVEESSSPDHVCQGARLCSKTYAVLKEGLTDRVENHSPQDPRTCSLAVEGHPTHYRFRNICWCCIRSRKCRKTSRSWSSSGGQEICSPISKVLG